MQYFRAWQKVSALFGQLDNFIALHDGKNRVIKRRGTHGRHRQRPYKLGNVWAKQNGCLGQLRLHKGQQIRGTVNKQSKRRILAMVAFDPKGKTKPEKTELQ